MRYRVEFQDSNRPAEYINADTFYNNGDMVVFSTMPQPTSSAAGQFNLIGTPTGFGGMTRQIAAFRNWSVVVEDNTYTVEQAGDTDEDI